jgi:hypothetical protein
LIERSGFGLVLELQCSPNQVSNLLIVMDVFRHTMSSTALPNVAFNKPPKVSPSSIEISSVAKDRIAASGMIAKKFRTKTVVGFQPVAPAIIPKGTKISRMLT